MGKIRWKTNEKLMERARESVHKRKDSRPGSRSNTVTSGIWPRSILNWDSVVFATSPYLFRTSHCVLCNALYTVRLEWIILLEPPILPIIYLYKRQLYFQLIWYLQFTWWDSSCCCMSLLLVLDFEWSFAPDLQKYYLSFYIIYRDLWVVHILLREQWRLTSIVFNFWNFSSRFLWFSVIKCLAFNMVNPFRKNTQFTELGLTVFAIVREWYIPSIARGLFSLGVCISRIHFAWFVMKKSSPVRSVDHGLLTIRYFCDD